MNNATLWLPLIAAAVLAVPAVLALARAFSAPVTRAAVQSYAVAMGRLALVMGALLLMVPGLFADLGTVTAWTLPLVGALCLALLAGLERGWPRQRGAVRVADLQRRRLRSVVRPSRTAFAGLAWLAMAAGVVAEYAVRTPVPLPSGGSIEGPGPAVTPSAASGSTGFASERTVVVTHPVPSMTWVWLALAGYALLTALAWPALLCGDLATALNELGIQAKGLVIGVAWLANAAGWVGALGVFVAWLAGPTKLPRTSGRPTEAPATESAG